MSVADYNGVSLASSNIKENDALVAIVDKSYLAGMAKGAQALSISKSKVKLLGWTTDPEAMINPEKDFTPKGGNKVIHRWKAEGNINLDSHFHENDIEKIENIEVGLILFDNYELQALDGFLLDDTTLSNVTSNETVYAHRIFNNIVLSFENGGKFGDAEGRSMKFERIIPSRTYQNWQDVTVTLGA